MEIRARSDNVAETMECNPLTGHKMGLLVPDEKRCIAKKDFSSAQNATGYYSGPETQPSATVRLRACCEITQKMSKKICCLQKQIRKMTFFGNNKAIKKCLKPYFHFIFASGVFIFDGLTE